jgi:hypothetical protein
MELLIEIFKSVETDLREIIKENENTTTTTFNFSKSFKFLKTEQVLPPKTITKKMMTDAFYKVLHDISSLKIYIDNVDITYEEEKLFQSEIDNHYMKYSTHLGGFPPVLPFILVRELIAVFYNNIIIQPYIQLRYMVNPTYYFCKIDITFRKSLVNNE